MNYSVWVGGQNRPFAVIISADWSECKVSDDLPYTVHSFGMRMDPNKNYKYSFSPHAYGSPSRVPLDSFDTVIGGTINEALEFVSSEIDRYVSSFGKPDGEAYYYTERLDKLSKKNRLALTKEFLATTDWDQGRFDS